MHYFHKVQDIGKDVQGWCHYHKNGQERKPSAGIRKEDGLFHCFTCGEVHTLPEVISHCFGHIDNGVFGWNWLLKNYGMVEKEERKDVYLDFGRHNWSNGCNNINNIDGHMSHINSNRKLAGNKEPEEGREAKFVPEEELDKYRYIHKYMYERGLTDEIIELFDIGYDRTQHCITFPVRDRYGNCLFIARRSVRTKFFSYPKGVEKPLYGLYELYNWGKYKVSMNVGNIGEIIVCESMFDALTAWVYGRYAVALNGLGNALQFKQLRDLPCRELVLATDNDEAGSDARTRIRKYIKNKLIMEYDYSSYPEGAKDLNDLTFEQFLSLKKIF